MSDLGNFNSVGPIQFGSIDGAAPVSFVTADSLAVKHELGARVIYKGEEYVFVHNAMSSAATAGVMLVASGLSGYSLTRSSVAADGLPICFVKHSDIPAGGYGWGLVRGLVQAHFSSTMVTGIQIGVGADGVVATWVGGSFPTGPLVGRTLSSATANGQGLCYVKCFG